MTPVQHKETERFAPLLWAEWSALRKARVVVVGLVVAALLTMLPGLHAAATSQVSCGGPGEECPAAPIGPGGEAVLDRFYFVHQSLDGDGSITARVTSLSGIITYPPPNHDEIVSGVVAWAKAGIIVKESTDEGTAYAAMMVTGNHGVRMQSNFTQDIAGLPDGVSDDAPRWLRLTRSGDTLTGYESSDGAQWSEVGEAQLSGLAATVQLGLFVTSPCDLTVLQGLRGGTQCRFTQATALFDNVEVQGKVSSTWQGDEPGASSLLTDWERNHRANGFAESGGVFTVTGSGDIAPLVTEGRTIKDTLSGTVAGVLVAMLVAVWFSTIDARQGSALVSAHLRSGRRLAAKAVVIGTATFITGLVAATIAARLGQQILRANGNVILPVSLPTELRVIVGTAALLAVSALFALALGALFRRRVPAGLAAIGLLIVPYLLAVSPLLPAEAARWLLRVTPAAAFAIQQTLPEYPHTTNLFAPQTGYFPLAPWAGFAVLCAYTALAFGLAVRARANTGSGYEGKSGDIILPPITP